MFELLGFSKPFVPVVSYSIALYASMGEHDRYETGCQKKKGELHRDFLEVI